MTETMVPIKTLQMLRLDLMVGSEHGNQVAEDSGLLPHQWQAYLIGDAQSYIKEITPILIWFGLATQLFLHKRDHSFDLV